MKLLYKRGKNYKILNNCWFHQKYETYHRELSGRFDGSEILDDKKIIGEINKNGKLEPIAHGIMTRTPKEILEIAKLTNLLIEMDNAIQGGLGMKLYYYQGRYQRAKELFE